MARMIAGVLLLLAVFISGTIAEEEQANEIVSLNYVSIDTSSLTYKRQAYVPVNLPQKKTKRHHKVLLKVRNTSLTDSIYLSRVDYYDSGGTLLNNLIDSALLIKPMATSEILVRNKETKEPVDNLMVQWHSNGISKPIVQAITMDGRNRIVMNESGVVIPGDSEKMGADKY